METRTTIDGVDVISVIRPNAKRTVVMLHGFGANYEDLAPLAPHLDPSGDWNWIFPDGILEVPLGPHMAGRAWFPIRVSELEATMERGELLDFADTVPEGMVEARSRLTSLLRYLRCREDHLVLGGFSQGAMMAVDVAAHLADSVAGLILFSGTIVNRGAWTDTLKQKHAVPFIQSHGRSDSLLGFAHAERLYRVLGDAGLKGDFLPFDGGHEIPWPIVQRAAAFLKNLHSKIEVSP